MLGSVDMGAMNWDEFQLVKSALTRQGLIKADVANIQHGVDFSGAFTPLVAQSLDPLWTSETFDDEDLVLTRVLEEVDVQSPLHEVVTVQSYGDEQGIEGFFAEGGSPEQEESTLARKTAQVKYIAVRRSITDAAAMTGIIGNGMVSKRGLETQRELGMQSLKGRYETALFQADSTMSPLHFDGIRRQILSYSPASNITDLRGAKISIQDLVKKLFALADAPNYAKIDNLIVPSTLLGELIVMAQSHGRFNPMQLTGGERYLVFNAGALFLAGPRGKLIPIKAAPKMSLPLDPPTVAAGKAPALVGGNFTVAAESAGSPQFEAAEYGDYYFKLVGVGDKGAAAPYTSAAITVGAGQRVKFTIDDAALPASGDNSLRYYTVYRSPKDGAAADAIYMSRFARNALGGSDETLGYDENGDLPGTADVYALTTERRAIYVAKLLGTIQRPLAETETAKPFLIMRFCSPHVKHTRKQAIWKNVDQGL
jgi:hypothetical protein